MRRIGHDMAPASDGELLHPAIAAKRDRPPRRRQIAASAAPMWAAINLLTTDPCVDGPMWPAPSMTAKRAFGITEASISAILRVGRGACSPRMTRTGMRRSL